MSNRNSTQTLLLRTILALLGVALAGFLLTAAMRGRETTVEPRLSPDAVVSGEPASSDDTASWLSVVTEKTTSFDELEQYFGEFFDFEPERLEEPLSPDLPRPDGEASGDAVGSADELPPAVPDSFRVDGTPALAIVVDDCGFSMEYARRLRNCKLSLTWAIIPNLRFSRETAEMLFADGIPFLIHVPMQAYVDADGKAGNPKFYSIGVGMSEAEVRGAIVPLLDSLPEAYGINNHRGSKATSDPAVMRHVMKVLRERGMFFMDSSTSSRTVAYKTAHAYGLETVKNNYFLDNESDREKVRAQAERAIAGAKKRGSAVAICHLRPETIAFFESIDESYFTNRGVRLVTLPELVKLRRETKAHEK